MLDDLVPGTAPGVKSGWVDKVKAEFFDYPELLRVPRAAAGDASPRASTSPSPA